MMDSDTAVGQKRRRDYDLIEPPVGEAGSMASFTSSRSLLYHAKREGKPSPDSGIGIYRSGQAEGRALYVLIMKST